MRAQTSGVCTSDFRLWGLGSVRSTGILGPPGCTHIGRGETPASGSVSQTVTSKMLVQDLGYEVPPRGLG